MLQALAMVTVGLQPNLWVAMPAMMVAGATWLAVVNTPTVASQLSLPDCTRARHVDLHDDNDGGHIGERGGVGQVASMIDVPDVRCCCSDRNYVVAVHRPIARGDTRTAGSDAGANFERAGACVPGRAPDGAGDAGRSTIGSIRRAPRVCRRDARKSRQPAADGRAVVGLFHDTSDPGHYIEYYLDESWADHLRRFDRFTAADADLRERRRAFHIGPEQPKVTRSIAEPLRE